ncbi:RluA family pseudouridine synthase [Pseudogracilibacillus sp. SO30301A]|uniref:RluA family pseudouridine synthase n=1 Tax=Pseudogracilibacillus sp. SO30301A TaxID=3098291 RepID=UPI00300E1083
MTFIHHIMEEEAGIRLDKLLTNINTEYSRQQIQQWIKGDYVSVNNEKQKANYKCKYGDIIKWDIPIAQTMEIKAEPIPLDILYEDEYLLVVNKPKGMLVHPTQSVMTNTLVNGLLHHCEYLSNLSGDDRPGIVHRLDKDTSGALLIAKDNETHEDLKKQFQDQTVTRIYEAVCFGVLSHSKGIIKAPIGRNPKNRSQMAVVENGREAETHFRVLKRFQQYTYVECELKTGRTHQIRVHLKYMNHPIVGDEVYCRKKSSLIKGQALYAKELGFIHPKTGVKKTFTVEQPEDFNNLLQRLENMS